MTNTIDISILFQRSFLLFVVEFFAFVVKSYVLFFLCLQAIKVSRITKSLILLVCVLIGGLFADLTWVLKLFRELFVPNMDYKLIILFIRLAWALSLIQFQALGTFIESLCEKNHRIKIHHIILLFFNFCIVVYFLYLAILRFDIVTFERSWIEKRIITYSPMYMVIILLVSSLVTFKKLKLEVQPKILKRQVIVLLNYLIFPYILTEGLQGFFLFSFQNAYLINSISTSLLTIAIFYCIHKIMGLRFLNFQDQVQAKQSFNFAKDFKYVLEKLGQVNTLQEINYVTQAFFKQAFDIAPSKTMLYLRRSCVIGNIGSQEPAKELTIKESIVENNVTNNDSILAFLKKNKILIKDEIEFSNFYQENDNYKNCLEFLEQLHADVFLPIFEKNVLIAYIIIECDSRGKNQFFNNVEHDEMLVYTSYLANIINVLQYGNLNTVLAQEKNLKEELYHKHQEINKYKESIGNFLRKDKQRKFGLIFYKQRKFVFGNQAAKDIITLNINMQEGHPLTQALRRVAHYVENYKSTHTVFATDVQGNKIVLLGVPNLERNNVIIIVYYPEISDVFRDLIDRLDDPSDWDYLFYLESTESGRLINQMIPGYGTQLMKFKINLLRAALSKKALLLDIPAQDALAAVEIVHYISLREELSRITLLPDTKMSDVAIKLFGLNPLFAGTTRDQKDSVEKPLFEKLDKTGTLFIENIHLLDMKIQNALADYIKYGYYRMYKSDQKVASSVRIICSTNQNLQTLVQENKFSNALFQELKQTTIAMPSFLTLSEQEFDEIITGFTEQAVATSPLKNLLELSVQERFKMLEKRPISLQEFKAQIKNALVKKSQKQEIFQDIKFETAYTISDPELSEALKLGKKALKDPKTIAMLLRKLKSQSKVAELLGVNRSSINRRLKQYNLI